MEERYIRNLGALTEQECAQLRTKTVFVAGCGGLGGYLIEMLLRLGVGAIRAADGDVFEVSNLNRQLLSSTCNLGRSKAEAAKDRAAEVNPGVRFTAIPAFLTEENAAYIGEGINAIVPHDADEQTFVLKVENKTGEIIGGCVAEAYEYGWSRM